MRMDEKETKAMAVLEQMLDHHLHMSFEVVENLDFFDRVDADILANLLQEIDETFFGEVGDDAHWESVYTGTGVDLWNALMSAWDGETLIGVNGNLKWMPSEERRLRSIGGWPKA